MLLVFIVVSIALVVLGFILYDKSYDFESLGLSLALFSGVIAVLSIITAVILTVIVVDGNYIPDKINMYEEENARIESDISDVINAYVATQENLQSGVIDKITNSDSPVTVIAAFPDINASSAIAKQIETYKDNNDKIKELKEDLITLPAARWWLYFGS